MYTLARTQWRIQNLMGNVSSTLPIVIICVTLKWHQGFMTTVKAPNLAQLLHLNLISYLSDLQLFILLHIIFVASHLLHGNTVPPTCSLWWGEYKCLDNPILVGKGAIRAVGRTCLFRQQPKASQRPALPKSCQKRRAPPCMLWRAGVEWGLHQPLHLCHFQGTRQFHMYQWHCEASRGQWWWCH